MTTKAVKILVVDDSDLTRSTLTQMLSGYECELAMGFDGMDGIKKALTFNPDIILLDILMPNLDGIKMLQVIKIINEVKQTPVIVISGNSSKTNVLSALEAGAEKVLSKPFDEATLVSTIEKQLAKRLYKKTSISSMLIPQDGEDELKKIFLKHFPAKERELNNAIINRDDRALQGIFHELKGVAASMGFPEVTEMSRVMELALTSGRIDWNFIKNQSEDIISLIERDTFTMRVK